LKLHSLSISSKLILLSLATSLMGLLAAIAAIAAYDQYSLRAVLSEEFSVMSKVIADHSSAAVVFDDNTLAQNNLNALQYREGVLLGCMYRTNTNDGTEKLPAPMLFAHFQSDDQQTCPPVTLPPAQQIHFENRYLEILQPISVDGGAVGVLYLRVSLNAVNTQLQHKLLAMIPVVLFAVSIAVLIGVLLSRHISHPLLMLGKTAALVAENDNYAIRADKYSDDEVGQVVDSFNHMLTVIEHEDARLRESEEKFRLISESSKVGIFQMDSRGQCTYSNEELASITGLSSEQLLSQGWLSVVHPDDKRRVGEQINTLIQKTSQHIAIDCSLLRPNGTVKWITGDIAPLRDADQQQIGFLGTLSDISELKQAYDQLEHMAFYDTLTGLANRRLFRNRLEHMLNNIQRTNNSVALILIDVDHFKNVNDSMGHDSGDTLLTVIAERLKQCVRFTDTVARLGGDEFAVILPNVPDMLTVSTIAEKILQGLSKPTLIDDEEVTVSASLGISVAPEDTNEAEVLIKNADMALYRAKDDGRNNFKFFTVEMNILLIAHLNLVQQLRHAIDAQSFLLHFQPQIDLNSGQLVGFEALVRWQHAERGLVSPLEFIPVAEETGLIIPLGRWILRAACQQMRALCDAKLVGSRTVMTVNLSLKQFEDTQLVRYIGEVLVECGLRPAQLELELTESMLMENLEKTLETLQNIKALGIGLSIDDFGTGYSSLSYLKRLPVNVIKVDRSFVMDIPGDTDDMEITAAVIAMAHKLRYKVVAEGIETEAQHRFLRESGCDYGQGYYFSRPLSSVELIEFCERYKSQLGNEVEISRRIT
jgi:diguanylate cyclase (GGDEF)-like protein/PAS domain S-box-containing protein